MRQLPDCLLNQNTEEVFDLTATGFALDYRELNRDHAIRVPPVERDMSAEVRKEIQLEIAHVLFLDVVAYSKLSINDQYAAVDELNQIVRQSAEFKRAEEADRLIKIPTGDGMALVFYTSPGAPGQCAVEISRTLKQRPRLQLRMGIHSGPVSGVIDVNERANLAGAGINVAKRVMDCGDAGHILVSKHVAEDLEEYEQWRSRLHDLGPCEVKHGVRVSVVNVYDDRYETIRVSKNLPARSRGTMCSNDMPEVGSSDHPLS